MWTLLKWLVIGHLHRWEVMGERSPVYPSDGTNIRPVAFRHTCRCSRCGAIRKFDT